MKNIFILLTRIWHFPKPKSIFQLSMLMTLSSTMLYAQDPLPAPLAHYPLTVTTYPTWDPANPVIEYRLYDVAGFGRHGVIENLTQGTSKSIFIQGDFLNDRHCIQKVSRENAHINIPNPYPHPDTVSRFSVMFWYYFASEHDQDIILTIPLLQIEKSGKGIILHTKESGTGREIHQGTDIFDQEGWYFIGLVSSDTTNKLYTSYAGTTYDDSPGGLSLAGSQTGSVNFTNRYASSKVLDQNFDGSLYGLRFFGDTLSHNQVNTYRNIDWNWAHLNTGASESNLFHIMEGAYSWFEFNGSAADSKSRNLVKTNSAHWINDRFDSPQKAAGFNTSTVINYYHSLFAGDYDTKDGYTISYWIKVDNNFKSTAGQTGPPFIERKKYNILFGKNSGNTVVWGMKGVKDRLGVVRQTTLGRMGSTKKPWFLWFYDPASIKQQDTWYHVIWVQHPGYMKVYVADKNQELLTEDAQGTLIAKARLNYNGAQSLNSLNITQWGFGGGKPVLEALDEARIYQWPMDEIEAYALHEIERKDTAPLIFGNTTARERTSIPEVVSLSNSMQLYPNPTAGNLTLDLALLETTTIELSVKDLWGRTLISETHHLSAGHHKLSIDDLRRLTSQSGLYLVEVNSPESSQVYKVLLE